MSNSRKKNIEAVAAGFDFPYQALERMKKSKHKRFKNNLPEYKLSFMCYLFELIYDLAIGFNNNVSRSIGFEVPLGIKVKS